MYVTTATDISTIFQSHLPYLFIHLLIPKSKYRMLKNFLIISECEEELLKFSFFVCWLGFGLSRIILFTVNEGIIFFSLNPCVNSLLLTYIQSVFFSSLHSCISHFSYFFAAPYTFLTLMLFFNKFYFDFLFFFLHLLWRTFWVMWGRSRGILSDFNGIFYSK